MITKDGGNRFRGDLFATYTGEALQSSNVSAEQTARGLTTPSATDVFYDFNAGVGGPVVVGRAGHADVLRLEMPGSQKVLPAGFYYLWQPGL